MEGFVIIRGDGFIAKDGFTWFLSNIKIFKTLKAAEKELNVLAPKFNGMVIKRAKDVVELSYEWGYYGVRETIAPKGQGMSLAEIKKEIIKDFSIEEKEDRRDLKYEVEEAKRHIKEAKRYFIKCKKERARALLKIKKSLKKFES